MTGPWASTRRTLSPAATTRMRSRDRPPPESASEGGQHVCCDELSSTARSRPQAGRAGIRRSAGARDRSRTQRRARRRRRRTASNLPLYLGMTTSYGTIPRCARPKPRSAKATTADGSAKTTTRGQARGRPGRPNAGSPQDRHPACATRTQSPTAAAIETAASRDTDREPSPFAQRVCREAERRRSRRCRYRRVILGRRRRRWIWAHSAGRAPSPMRSRSSTSSTPKATSGTSPRPSTHPGPNSAAQWAKQRRDELDAGEHQIALVAALAHHAPTCDEARKCIDYLIRNRKRMRYSAFRARGLCVATRHRRGWLANMPSGRASSALGMHCVRQRRQCHPRPALLHPQRTLRSLRNDETPLGMLTAPHKSDVHPDALFEGQSDNVRRRPNAVVQRPVAIARLQSA